MLTRAAAPTVERQREAAFDHDIAIHSIDGVVDLRCRVCRPGDLPTSAEVARFAEGLVAERLSIESRRVRVASLAPSGRPVAFVSGVPTAVCLSISHVPGLVGAAVSGDAWIGLDIVDPAEAGRGLDVWFTPDELALAPDDGRLRAVLWAAKEAAYKACRLDTEFRPRGVVIDSLDGRSFAWTVHDRFDDVRGTGQLLAIGRHVVALATTAAGRGPGRSSRGHAPAADHIVPDRTTAETQEALSS
jgi:hypothetical protein